MPNDTKCKEEGVPSLMFATCLCNLNPFQIILIVCVITHTGYASKFNRFFFGDEKQKGCTTLTSVCVHACMCVFVCVRCQMRDKQIKNQSCRFHAVKEK